MKKKHSVIVAFTALMVALWGAGCEFAFYIKGPDSEVTSSFNEFAHDEYGLFWMLKMFVFVLIPFLCLFFFILNKIINGK